MNNYKSGMRWSVLAATALLAACGGSSDSRYVSHPG